MWVTFQVWPPGPGYTEPIDHWVASVDLDRLYTPAPVALPATAGERAVIQAEHTGTTGTRLRAPGPDGAISVDATAHMLRCRGACADDGIPGDGFLLGDDTGGAWRTVTGPEVHLDAGLHTLALTPAGGGWHLNWFQLTRR